MNSLAAPSSAQAPLIDSRSLVVEQGKQTGLFPTDRLRPAMLIDNPKVRTVSWHAGLFF
jgi:hypothetical protein